MRLPEGTVHVDPGTDPGNVAALLGLSVPAVRLHVALGVEPESVTALTLSVPEGTFQEVCGTVPERLTAPRTSAPTVIAHEDEGIVPERLIGAAVEGAAWGTPNGPRRVRRAIYLPITAGGSKT